MITIVLLVGLAGCAGGGSDDVPGDAVSTSDAPLTGREYVALGDSYAAAPGLPRTDVAGGCFRSDHNYPALLAAEAGYDLVDVTCSGAKTDDITGSQYDGVPPQVDALSADTELVTIGIGGNDFDLVTELFGACISAANATSTSSPCTSSLTDEVQEAAAGLPALLDTTLAAVTAAAPDARVIVVPYPRLTPAAGTTCPDRLAIAPGDLDFVTDVNRGLDDALRAAAETAGADYVDVFAASEGHDVCSDDPWVNGQQTAPDGVIPLHPLAAGQEGVASLIADML